MPVAVESINGSVPSIESAEILPSPETRKLNALVLIADASGKGGMYKSTGSAWESMGAAETWRSGSGPPNAELGFPGDFYLDLTTSGYYGPKTDAGWGEPTSLIGIQGTSIDTATGPPSGPGDLPGDVYIDNSGTGAGDVYQWDGGAWNLEGSVRGPQGFKGDTGDPGAGVPAGGSEGQVIRRTASGSTEWTGPDVFVGEMKPYAGATSPSANWRICDGAAVSRTDYAALYAAIGTTYGSGDGSTTFNLPDMRGRTAIGAGQGPSLANRGLGAAFGAEAVGLVEAQLPAHAHSVGNSGSNGANINHAHEIRFDSSAVQSGTGISAVTQIYNSSTSGNATRNTQPSSPATAHTHTNPATGAIGSGNAHPNMQPSAVINYLIKVA